ncbi:glycosyltransferase involved in cell wall biosynthesis [Catalinimonas alkaloidigena]|uniref:glycosyltransferase family 4 protein n=1 Tax=Catalinimonas alkaloidigena TaxID=1075417 RepID=UPI002406582A|nr:glycosyltransferase family 4 protein [Catalinimonas alkaloidigena]MDF9799717.1 glycosyltransferase involved in cell wall biosynthesis [Catalinimonas alkaloidigena]
MNTKNYQHEIIDTSGYKLVKGSHGSFSTTKVLSFLNKYWHIYKIRKYDVIYITIAQTFLGVLKYTPFIIMAQLLRKPYVFHLHGNYLYKTIALASAWQKVILKKLISPSSGAIVLSDSLKKNFTPFVLSRNIHSVQNFALPELYNITFEKKKFDKLRLVYLSNLMKEKGILEFLEALHHLQREGIDFEAKVAGRFEEESRKQVENKMNKLDPHSFSYLGVVQGEEKYKLLLEANVFVLPTYYKIEGQPISILEAMASGNIIVTTRQGGIPDVVSEKNGFFVKKRDPVCLSETLKRITANLPSLVEMSKWNSAYASKTFTVDNFGENIIKILSGVVRNEI